MKKRNFALCGLAVVAGLSIAGCNNDNGTKPTEKKTFGTYTYELAPADEVYDSEAGTVDIHLNYNGVQGVTYRGTAGTSWANAVNGVTYTNGTLLPTWEAFAAKTKTTIREACGYNATKDADNHKQVSGNEFKSDTDKTQFIDLYYNTTSNINSMGNSNQAVDLTSYIEAGKMPNFKKYLDANKAVREEITTSTGAIYFTPYFDSYNDIERCLVMDSSLVQLVLDKADAEYDTAKKNGKNGDSNVVTDVKYQPFINKDYNYEKDTTVKVSVDGKAQNLTIKKTDNIIKQQNALLEKGCTGKELAEQFKAYLKAAFGDNVGSGKLYENYSQIFTEEQAAYNVDELVALMRVVKANPGLITGAGKASNGDQSKEVETLFPRGQAANRIQNMLHFAQVWGVQGLVSEKDFLYFLQDGTLNDARTSQASYDALDNLAALYSEGLILTDFWYYSSSAKDGNAYLNQFFKKSTTDYSFGLMEYDYVATQCVGNDIYDGIGTASSARKAYTGKVTGIKPILPPLSMWGTEKTVTHDQALNNFTGKTLMRHYDENRSIKGNSWCIPASSDNKEGAVRIMDYLFSDMGLFIQDFGPEAYWAKPNLEGGDKLASGLTYDATKTYIATDGGAGKAAPILSKAQKAMIAATNLDFWTYMRACMGSTHGIGHERTGAIQVQATNFYGQVGYAALEASFASGATDLSLVDKDGDNKTGTVTWNTSVPVNNYSGAPAAKTADANSYDATLTFWAQDKNKDVPTGWVYAVANGGWKALGDTAELGTTSNSNVIYKKSDVVSQQDNMNKKYLFAYANSLNKNFKVETFIPEYAKTAA